MTERTTNVFPSTEQLAASKRTWDADQAAALRDQFAIAALTGLLANVGRDGDEKDYAADAYRFADAMMKASEGGE